MFKFIIGLKGAGKSYYATYLALKHLKKGLKVYSNFPINGANILDTEDLTNFFFPAKSLIILDEAGVLMNCRNWSKLDMATLEFFSQSRKSNGVIGG